MSMASGRLLRAIARTSVSNNGTHWRTLGQSVQQPAPLRTIGASSPQFEGITTMLEMATIMTADRVRGSVPLKFLREYAHFLHFVESTDGVWLPSCDLEQYERGDRCFQDQDNDRIFKGKTYAITLIDGLFYLDDYAGAAGTYDSFEALVEDHPICAEAREFFFGVTIRNTNERLGDTVEYTGETLGAAVAAFQADVTALGYGTVTDSDWIRVRD